jgi:hypothetical protein
MTTDTDGTRGRQMRHAERGVRHDASGRAFGIACAVLLALCIVGFGAPSDAQNPIVGPDLRPGPTGDATKPAPQLAVIEVRPLAAGDPATPITVFGKAFQPDSTIQVAGMPIPTTYRTADEMSGTIPAHLLVAPRELTVEVRTPGPGGGTSLAGRVAVAASVFPGRFVVFTSNRRGGRNHVYLLDRQRSWLDPLEEANSASANDGYPAISADGRFIVFQSDRHRGQYDVFLFDRERRVLDPLSGANHPTAFDGFPSISADGRFIVFESDRLGKPKLFLFDLQGRTLSELSRANEGSADDGLAAISN